MKGVLYFLYRAWQKWRYHTSSDPFRKLVAELNRYEPQVELMGDSFSIPFCGLKGNIKLHGFLLTRFDVFRKLALVNRGGFEVRDSQVVYRIDDLTMRVTTAEELFIIHEIFFQNAYSIEVPEEAYIVVDVGMNVGFASLFFARCTSVKKIYAYEPFGPTYQNALSNFRLNPRVSKKVVPLNFGLGASDEVLDVPYSRELKGKNSIINQVGDSVEKVQIRSASSVIRALVQKHASDTFYMKIDCEGAEVEIFQSFANQPFPECIRGVLLEWHKKYPVSIVEYLRQNAFRIQNRGAAGIGIIIAFR